MDIIELPSTVHHLLGRQTHILTVKNMMPAMAVMKILFFILVTDQVALSSQQPACQIIVSLVETVQRMEFDLQEQKKLILLLQNSTDLTCDSGIPQ